jgi:hypothetical protein
MWVSLAETHPHLVLWDSTAGFDTRFDADLGRILNLRGHDVTTPCHWDNRSGPTRVSEIRTRNRVVLIITSLLQVVFIAKFDFDLSRILQHESYTGKMQEMKFLFPQIKKF